MAFPSVRQRTQQLDLLTGERISARGAPESIYRAWRAARFELVTSTAQLDELRRVSRYPKLKAILPAHRIGAMVNNMQRAARASLRQRFSALKRCEKLVSIVLFHCWSPD